MLFAHAHHMHRMNEVCVFFLRRFPALCNMHLWWLPVTCTRCACRKLLMSVLSRLLVDCIPDSVRFSNDSLPVTFVGIDEARAYCAWAGKRLPSDIEWQYAGQGGQTERQFPWGQVCGCGSRVRGRVLQSVLPLSSKSDSGTTTTARSNRDDKSKALHQSNFQWFSDSSARVSYWLWHVNSICQYSCACSDGVRMFSLVCLRTTVKRQSVWHG